MTPLYLAMAREARGSMPKIDIAEAPTRFGSAYPPPFDAPCRDRRRWKLGDAAGLRISA